MNGRNEIKIGGGWRNIQNHPNK